MTRAALAFRSCSPCDDDELSRGSFELLLPRSRSVPLQRSSKGRAKSTRSRSRSSIPLHRIGLNLVERVCEIIAEIELAARFLRWIPTQGVIFGSGSRLGELFAVSRDQGVSRRLGCCLCCLWFLSIVLRLNELKSWKLVELDHSKRPSLPKWLAIGSS